MLGTRGCRLGLMYPEIYEMQVRAIVRAAIAVRERTGDAPLVEIMHPLVAFEEELRRLRELTIRVAERGRRAGLPRRDDDRAPARVHPRRRDRASRRLLLVRDERPDADRARLLARRRRGQVPDDATSRTSVLERNPFEVLDEEGVGDLMRIAVERGRGEKEDIKLGICGEHGGEPRSVAFCHRIGLDYVSCSPYRVPLARLAAAQAALVEQGSRRQSQADNATPSVPGSCSRRRSPDERSGDVPGQAGHGDELDPGGEAAADPGLPRLHGCPGAGRGRHRDDLRA